MLRKWNLIRCLIILMGDDTRRLSFNFVLCIA